MSTRHGNLQKYRNANPLQRYLIGRFLQRVSRLVAGLDCSTVLDVGSAEGFVSLRLVENVGRPLDVVGVDIDFAAHRRGKSIFPEMRRSVGSITELPFAEGTFDLVLCTEVLEHLVDPAMALRQLHRVAARYCLLSVPYEPWFRTMNFLRGRHLRRLGNDPEHRHNWSRRQFHTLVSQVFQVVATETVIPWTIVLGRPLQ